MSKRQRGTKFQAKVEENKAAAKKAKTRPSEGQAPGDVSTTTTYSNRNIINSLLHERDRLAKAANEAEPTGETAGYHDPAENEPTIATASTADEDGEYHCNVLRSAKELDLGGMTLDGGVLLAIKTCVSLTKLRFTVKEGTEVDVQQLGSLKALEELCIEYVGGKLLNVNTLSELRSLKTLCFSGNCIEALEDLTLRGCRDLKTIEGIHLLPNLKALNLERTSVNRGFLRQLCVCKKLKELNLSCCGNVENISDLAQVTTLEVLHLSRLRKVPKGFEIFGQLERLRVLNLGGADITNEHLNSVSSSKSLVSLNLSWCSKIIDISALARLKALEELGLDCCQKITTSLTVLRPLTKLCVLRIKLYNSPQLRFWPAWVRNVSKVPKLKASDGGTMEIIPAIDTLEGLDLGNFMWTSITGDSYMNMQIPQILRITESPVQGVLLAAICFHLHLVTLDLACCRALKDISCISHLGTLEELDLHCCDGIERGWSALGRLSRLRILNLSKTRISEDAFRRLCPELKVHCLGPNECCNLGDISPVKQVKSLERLALNTCYNIRGTEAVLELPQLVWIDIDGANVTDEVRDALVANGVVLGSIFCFYEHHSGIFDCWRAQYSSRHLRHNNKDIKAQT